MRWTKIKQTFWGMLRLQLYVLCVGGALAYASFVRAYDHVEQTLGELGFDMLAGLGALERGVEQVELNGQAFTFAATALAQHPAEVISEFEDRCARGSGGLAGDLAGVVDHARRRGQTLPQGGDPARWLTRTERAVGRDSAHSSCFVRDDAASGDLWASLSNFARSGKLGELGDFRYVRADRGSDSDVTRVLAIASNGDFDIDALLPETGDARGSDPRIAPRPPEATRRFSARIVRGGQGAYVYTSIRSREEIARHYDRALPARGLPRVNLPVAEGGASEDARAYAAGDGAVIISITADEAESQVAIFELGKFHAQAGAR